MNDWEWKYKEAKTFISPIIFLDQFAKERGFSDYDNYLAKNDYISDSPEQLSSSMITKAELEHLQKGHILTSDMITRIAVQTNINFRTLYALEQNWQIARITATKENK